MVGNSASCQMRTQTRFRKALSVMLALMLCWTVPLCPQQAYALDPVFTDPWGSQWYYRDNGQDITLTGEKSLSGDDIVLPARINGKPVVAVEGDYFLSDAYLNSVTFPSTIKSITDDGNLFLSSAADTVFFLGPCPEDIDWYGLSWSGFDDYYCDFYALSEYVDGWEDSSGNTGTWNTFKAPTSVGIFRDGEAVDEINLVAGADNAQTIEGKNLLESTSYKSFHTKLYYSSSNSQIKVTSSGKISAAEGTPAKTTATITVENAIGLYDTVTVTVIEPSSDKQNIDEACAYSPAEIGDIYSNFGNPAIPEVTVVDAESRAKLELGVDYTVSYETQDGAVLSQAPTTPGSYNMVFTGGGFFVGRNP